jgi:hypothetical protein
MLLSDEHDMYSVKCEVKMLMITTLYCIVYVFVHPIRRRKWDVSF